LFSLGSSSPGSDGAALNKGPDNQGKGAEVDDGGQNDVNDFGSKIVELQVVAAHSQIADEQTGKKDADGVGQTQQGDGNAGKTFRGQVIDYLDVLARPGQVEEPAAQAGQCAGDNHGEDDVALFVDTGIPAGIPVVAHRLELKAE